MSSDSGPKACVIGYPINHSRSPLIHNYWLKTLGLPGHYGRVDVSPEDIQHFFMSMASGAYVGCNVTLPHKETVCRLVERRTARADRLQAVNTVWFENGKACGDSTDTIGFLSNLDQRCPGWDRSLEKAIVLGAGGASAAVIAALIERGTERVFLFNRNRDRAIHLAERMGSNVEVHPWEDAVEGLRDAAILVNTTSLGMKGHPDLSLNLAALPDHALVTDIVYVPLETGLLTQARLRGNPVVDGLGMLLHQAVPGFEHWFGIKPEVTPELRALIEADLVGTGT